MKLHKTVCAPIATLTLIGSLIGGANAATTFNGNLSMQVTGIDVIEATDPIPDTYNFVSSSIALLDTSTDFTGWNEYYAVYWSDADGTLNPTGSFLSIGGSTGGDNGFNIVEVMFNNNALDPTYVPFIASTFGDDTIMGESTSILAINGVTTDYVRFKTGDARITIGFQTVPEPSSAMLLGLGSLGLAFRRSRR